MPPPLAIRKMPSQYRDKLMARLAWDLAERLKFGLALGLVGYDLLDTRLLDEPNLAGGIIGWAAREQYFKREGCWVTEPTRPAWSYFLQEKDRPPPTYVSWTSELRQRKPELHEFLVDLNRKVLEAVLTEWPVLTLEGGSGRALEVNGLFCGRNTMLDQGAPFYLRNTDFGWYSEFARHVIDRFSIKSMARWLYLRDQTNNLLAADMSDNFRKMDSCYVTLFRKKSDDFVDKFPEDYGTRSRDVELQKICGARETCRSQDEFVLDWFCEKGLRWNPYTKWLHQLVQLRDKSLAEIDWDEVQAKAREYVPRSEEENDELRLAQLDWCLSRPNPVRYPYRSRFRPKNRAEGEAALQRWWKRAEQEAAARAGHPVNR
jgi:hypothetical protein